MNRFNRFRFLICVPLLFLILPDTSFGQTSTAPASGDGSEGDPYQIATLDNLYWLSQTTSAWDDHFIQTADIDAADTENWDSGAGFSPIGISGTNFTGSYDGNGFTISNLTINRPETNHVGLFGFIYAELKNIGLINVNITGRDNTGALFGQTNTGDASIVNCYSSGVVQGRNLVGGLGGKILYSQTTGNYSSATVTGLNTIGGLFGESRGIIADSYSTGNVSGDSQVGGLIGAYFVFQFTPSVSSSYSSGMVTAETEDEVLKEYTGGLIGWHSVSGETVQNSFWNTETSGQETSGGPSPDNAIGLTSSQMRQEASYTDWDFSGSGPWEMIEETTFPYLKSIPQDPAPGVASEFTAELAGSAEGWRMLTAPTVNATYQELLSTIWTQGFPGADTESGTANVYWYNETDRTWNAPNNITNIVGSGSNSAFLNSGRGILVYVFENHLNDGNLSGWPKQLAIENIAPFSNIVVSFSRTISDPDDSMQGWHLVGNPYPFSISWVDMVENNALDDVMPPIFIFDANANSGAGGYRVHYGFDIPDLPSEIAHDGVIPPFQAFWSRTSGNSTSGTITFSTKYSTLLPGTLYSKQRTGAKTNPYLALYVKGNGMAGSALLTFKSEHSFIAEWPVSLSAQTIEFGFTDNDNRLYALQNISPESLEDNTIEIPLVFESGHNGSYEINISGMENLPNNLNVTLIDTHTNSEVDLTSVQGYTFAYKTKHKTSSEESFGKPASPGGLITGRDKNKSISESRFIMQITQGTSVNIDPAGTVPASFGLAQNFPNPFNPSTVIRYQLPVNSDVRLEVFDMLGRRVAVLVNDRVTAGFHEAAFDASHLSSGVYLYRLQAGSQVFTKKLTLIK